jgi:hypothetical protein
VPVLELLALLLAVPGALAALGDLRSARQLSWGHGLRRCEAEFEIALRLHVRLIRLL